MSLFTAMENCLYGITVMEGDSDKVKALLWECLFSTYKLFYNAHQVNAMKCVTTSCMRNCKIAFL